jgi:hypothetical protein
MALTKCGSFSLAAAPHHPAGPSADESRRWSNAPEPPVRTRSRAVTLTEAGWRLVPYTDTLHRQIDEARTDARAGFQVSVELAAPQPFAVPGRLLRLDRGDLRPAQPWTRPARFRKPRRLRASDWRRMSPVPALPQPSGIPVRLDLPCFARRWSGSMSWRWTAPGGCESIRPAPFEGEEHEP